MFCSMLAGNCCGIAGESRGNLGQNFYRNQSGNIKAEESESIFKTKSNYTSQADIEDVNGVFSLRHQL